MSTSDPVASHAASPTVVPALYVSHGAPLFAVDAGETGPALTRWGQGLRAQFPVLRGVVIMSPHWMARTPQVMTSAQPATWHDFGGFPPALYQLQYPAPGAPALAQEVLALLQAAGVAAQGDAGRPFDHGAWVPLMHCSQRPTCRWCKWRCPWALAPPRSMPWAPRCAACAARACW